MSLTRPCRPALIALLVAAVLTGCGSTPDTSLHPAAPAVTYTPPRNPFLGATLVRDPDTAAARWQRTHRATWLNPISRTPQARWLNGTEDLKAVPELVRQARRQQARVVLVAYNVPNRGCSKFSQGAPTSADYDRWIDRLVSALGDEPAAIVMEPDAIAADCFDPARATDIQLAVERLSTAGHAVYLDAGHARWRSTGEMAARLLQAGIDRAEGFAVNVSNRQHTDESYRWARELSDLVGDREFVIDTSRNGMGPPPDDPARDDEWCNARHQALGDQPTTNTGRPGLAALLWIKPPGESDGICGGERTYLFSPSQAANLIANTDRLPEATRRKAAAQRLSRAS